ncbi:MAG: glycosyltransferase, partial [Bacteroidota bacterium]
TYGIPIRTPSKRYVQFDKPLKLLFLGRHDVSKGVYDLFEINNILEQRGVFAEWLILGKGPETKGLQQQWHSHQNVTFLNPESTREVLEIADRADVMVFPTKFEGFPVALLECMSQGCVPVVTNLPGGIQELVEEGITGFRCKINDNEQFAQSIITLHTNREMLLQLQMACIGKVHEKYNAKICAPAYQEVFKKLTEDEKEPRHHAINVKIGSRLDKPYIPNFLTSLFRFNK